MKTASSIETLIFILTGIAMWMPSMLVYNGFQYLVFSNKPDTYHPEIPKE